MVNSSLNMSATDFTDNALADLAVDITKYPVTKGYSNTSGSITRTYGSPVTIQGVIVKRSKTFDWQKENLFVGGDGVISVTTDVTLNKDDMIVFNGEKFRIDTVITREIAGVELFKKANFYYVQDA